MVDQSQSQQPHSDQLSNFNLTFPNIYFVENSPLQASKLGSPFSVSWSLDNGALCDCHDLTEPYLRYRLHFMPKHPSTGETMYSSSLATADSATMEWYLKSWGERIVAFDSWMEPIGQDVSPERLMEIISRGKIPQADIAVLPIADPNLARLLERLGSSLADDCIYDHEVNWNSLVASIRSGQFLKEWQAAELEEGRIVVVPERSPHLISIDPQEHAAIFATFYNNASSPGMSAAVKAAAETMIDVGEDGAAILDLSTIGSDWHEMSIKSAELLFHNLTDRSFDYFRGRRMKLYLGTAENPRTEFSGESFDQCAYPGAARFLVRRYRETGEVSSCLRYYIDNDGLTKAYRPVR